MNHMIKKLIRGITTLVARCLWTAAKIVLLIIGREVLMRKQAEARTDELVKREAHKRMNEFLNIASHELKTPLTSIKGNVQLMGRKLKQGLAANELNASGETRKTEISEASHLLVEAKELLERIDKQITQLSRLVQILLESSRINANTMDLLLELCELDTLVRETAQDAHHIPATRTVHVQVLSENTILVMADVHRVKQVVIHYLSNAHKFSPLDQSIDVSVKVERGIAYVAVHDAGPGIPPNEHNKIWERFYRVPGVEVQNGSEVGLGLGLHICRTVIEQHHGHVGVQSKSGVGSTFWFTLPVASYSSPT